MEDNENSPTNFGADLGKAFVVSIAASAGTVLGIGLAGFIASKVLERRNARKVTQELPEESN